jgi:hypothetical protein
LRIFENARGLLVAPGNVHPETSESATDHSIGQRVNGEPIDDGFRRAFWRKEFPTLRQRPRHPSMPATTDIERRDRALIAFAILTGARDGAIASFKLRHIDIVEGKLDQDARDVRTKFSKSFVSSFFPVGDDIRAIVVDWVNYLRHDKLWGPDDPLFPMTKVAVGPDLRFAAAGLDRKHWSSASPIRAIFKQAFAAAGLPYFNAHSFPKHAGAARRRPVREGRALQGMVTEPGARGRADDP